MTRTGETALSFARSTFAAGVRGMANLAAGAVYARLDKRTVKRSSWSRLVFVCTGNICRSPYAERRARMMGFESISFGVSAASTRPADPSALRNASVRGLSLAGHASAALENYSARAGDLMVVMEGAHRSRVQQLADATSVSVVGLGSWCHPPRSSILDPFGLDDAVFQDVFAAIDAALLSLTAKMPAATSSVRQGQAGARESA